MNADKQSGMPLLEMINVGMRFGLKVALENAGLILHEGEILGLVGDNGAGKSTLLNILSGATKKSAGQIRFLGKSCRKMTPRFSRSLGIEMVFQDLALCENMTIWENIYLGRYRYCRRGAFVFPFLDTIFMRQSSLHCMMEVGLDEVDVDCLAGDLSGGQRQAVAICRAMLFQPRVILLDEPTASLAVKEQKRILNLITKIRSKGVSVIMISHDISQVVEITDRVVVLKEGKTIWSGRTDSVTPEELVQKMFVGSPDDGSG